MKNLKNIILKAGMIVLGLCPLISNAQNNYPASGDITWGTPTTGANLYIDPRAAGGIMIGSSTAGRTALQLVVSASTGGYSAINSFQSQGSTNGNLILNQYGGNIGIGTGTTAPRATLDVKGKVVIGTLKSLAADYQLSVDGKIYCTEVNVLPAGAGTNWSDYVFKSDYKLSSLKEVEEHIKAKGHLKDVPSSEEVAKSGYKVGEMDATLLRKIEELTLYLLEQDKKYQVQQKEIENLKAQLGNK